MPFTHVDDLPIQMIETSSQESYKDVADEWMQDRLRQENEIFSKLPSLSHQSMDMILESFIAKGYPKQIIAAAFKRYIEL